MKPGDILKIEKCANGFIVHPVNDQTAVMMGDPKNRYVFRILDQEAINHIGTVLDVSTEILKELP